MLFISISIIYYISDWKAKSMTVFEADVSFTATLHCPCKFNGLCLKPVNVRIASGAVSIFKTGNTNIFLTPFVW